MTYTLIAHQELTSSQASITFSSIPQTFTDLLIQTSLRGDRNDAIELANLSFNGTSANRTWRYLRGLDTAAGSFSGTSAETGFFPTAQSATNTFGSMSIYIPNYRVASSKSFSADNASPTTPTTWASLFLVAGLWSNNTAITSITLSGLANLVSGSSATLYGITAGSSGGVVVS